MLRRRYRLIQSTASLPGLVGVFGYMLLLTDLPATEWMTWWGCLVVYAAAAGVVHERAASEEIGPIVRFLDSEADASDRSDLSRAAFAAVVALPIRIQRRHFIMGLLPVVLFPIAMELLGHSGWLEWGRLRTYGFASLVAALFAAALHFYWTKHEFAGLRSELARVVGDPEVRAGLVTRLSLLHKLRFAVTVPVVASVLLVINVVYDSLQAVAERSAIDWSETALGVVADADSTLSFDERVASRLPDSRIWPVPLELLEIPSGGVQQLEGPEMHAGFADALDAALATGASTGRVRSGDGSRVGAYRRTGSGALLIASVGDDEFGLDLRDMGFAMLLVCTAIIAAAFSIGTLVCRDVWHALTMLRDEADRIAAGDLRTGDIFESEDELGDLGRAFDVMERSLRSTVGRVHGAADRVERTAVSVAEVVGALTQESRDQFERIRQANELMVGIDAQIRELSKAVQALNDSIESSSSSAIELGASGEELNETATVLSSKVDEVSASLEQMVRSVKEVRVTTDRLVEASEETSCSMEEMASAMRVVDTSAETTAKLSEAVVEKAELGQARVSQTITGMDAIREATAIAENVIRGLGARTNEIGGILDVIADVADETNLLALNAAIIAAQAGEHGRAFSVVADEIKELADRVLASTKEVGGLIRSVQEESENAIGAIEAGAESVMSGVQLSAEAGLALEEITAASRESGTRITEIVSSVREQTRAASHVVVLMEKVRDSAEQIAAAGNDQDRSHEVVYRSALTMREVAQQVQTTTVEQARGFSQIGKAVEGVRSTVEDLNASLREQSGACGRVAEFLDSVFQGTRANEAAAERMGEAVEDLAAQAESLRKDVEQFRIA